MLADRVVHAPGESLDCPLELGILEGLGLATAVADQVMVVLAAWMDRLVAGHGLAHVHPPHEAHVVEKLERAVDARHAHALAALPQPVGDLLGGDAAAELVEVATTAARGALTR